MMRKTVFLLFLAASVAVAQTPGKSASQTSKPATTTQGATHATTTAGNLPGKIPVVHGVVKTAFALKYEDYKIGTGPLAEPNKLYHLIFTGYLASTGDIFESSAEHRQPVMKDGKPVMGPDGKPQMDETVPYPQGFGRYIPGFDQGFEGMHVGGKRRLFVPWELGFGMRDIPARGGHAGIPPKSNLIYDIELVNVTDMPQPPARPMSVPPHPGTPGVPPQPAKPGAPAAPAQPQKPATPPPASAPAAPPAASAPSPAPAPAASGAPATASQQQPK